MKIKKLEFFKSDSGIFSLDTPIVAQTPLGTIYKITRKYRTFTLEYMCSDVIIDKFSCIQTIEAAIEKAQQHFEQSLSYCYE